MQQQREEEEKLANQQSELLKAQYKKYDLLQAVFEDGSAKRLGRQYEIPLADAWLRFMAICVVGSHFRMEETL